MWVRSVAPTALRLVFQNLLQEQDAAVAELSQALWSVLLKRLGAGGVAAALPSDVVDVRCSTMPKPHLPSAYPCLSRR